MLITGCVCFSVLLFLNGARVLCFMYCPESSSLNSQNHLSPANMELIVESVMPRYYRNAHTHPRVVIFTSFSKWLHYWVFVCMCRMQPCLVPVAHQRIWSTPWLDWQLMEPRFSLLNTDVQPILRFVTIRDDYVHYQSKVWSN